MYLFLFIEPVVKIFWLNRMHYKTWLQMFCTSIFLFLRMLSVYQTKELYLLETIHVSKLEYHLSVKQWIDVWCVLYATITSMTVKSKQHFLNNKFIIISHSSSRFFVPPPLQLFNVDEEVFPPNVPLLIMHIQCVRFWPNAKQNNRCIRS